MVESGGQAVKRGPDAQRADGADSIYRCIDAQGLYEIKSYYAAVAEAIDRCSPMPFTESMGGAVAGRVFRVNFIDMRNRRQAEVPWLTGKS